MAANSVETKLTPVRLPPGRARLATRPSLTGSSLDREDDGDCRGCGLGRERRHGYHGSRRSRSTRRRTNSAASDGNRSSLEFSAQRIDRSSRSRPRRSRPPSGPGETRADELWHPPRLWRRETRSPASPAAARCAASGHAAIAAAPPSVVMNSRRLMGAFKFETRQDAGPAASATRAKIFFEIDFCAYRRHQAAN